MSDAKLSPAEELAASKFARRGRRVVRPVAWVCKVREARKAIGLTLIEVGREIGVVPGTLSQVERGVDPTLTTARKIAAFFGKTVEELWPELAEPKEKP